MNFFMDNKLFIVSTWGILPVLWAFMVFLCTIIIKCMKKEIFSPVGEFCNTKKAKKSEKIYSKVDYFSEIYFFISLKLIVFPFLAFFNAKYDSYIYEMIDKIEVVSNIVIGLTAITITMAVVVILFDKRYYIVFSIRDVLKKYKFSEFLINVIFSCIVVSIATLTLLNKKIDSYFDVAKFMILEIETIFNILGVAYILCVIINIMFLEQKNELSLLGQLYRKFGLYKIDTLHFKSKKSWSKEAVEINVEYLLERYINVCNRKKIFNIKSVEFVTTMGCYKQKWYDIVRKKFALMMLFLLIVSFFINKIILKENCMFINLLNIFITLFSIIFANANVQCFQFVLMRLYLDTWGYYLNTNNKKKNLFVPTFSLRTSTIYNKYIMRMNSLNAFFYIWINYVNKKKHTIEYEFKEILLKLDSMDKHNMITYFPAFTIGFFLFEKNIKIEKIKDLYNEMVAKENKQHSFQRMMHSQIFNLTKNFNEELFEYRDGLNKYLQWISE